MHFIRPLPPPLPPKFFDNYLINHRGVATPQRNYLHTHKTFVQTFLFIQRFYSFVLNCRACVCVGGGGGGGGGQIANFWEKTSSLTTSSLT